MYDEQVFKTQFVKNPGAAVNHAKLFELRHLKFKYKLISGF